MTITHKLEIKLLINGLGLVVDTVKEGNVVKS